MRTQTHHAKFRGVAMIAVLIAISLFAAMNTGNAREAFRFIYPGERVGAFSLTSESDSTWAISPHAATLIVLWANWSEASLACLHDIHSAAVNGALHWRILAVNLDPAEAWATDSDAIVASARAAGIENEVWRSAGSSQLPTRLIDNWGVMALPSVIVVGSGGMVSSTVRGWTDDTRAQFLQMLTGAPAPGGVVPADTGVARCRRAIVRAGKLWRGRQAVRAIRELVRVRMRCPDWPAPSLVIARWSAIGGDTAAERSWVSAAFAADSTDPMALAEVAFLALADGRPDAAQAYAKRALAGDSFAASAWSVCALAGLALGDIAEAERAWTALGDLNRFVPEYDLIGARLNEAKGETARAAYFWRRVIEREFAERKRPFLQRSRRHRP